MNASVHSRLELPDQRPARAAALVLLAGLGLTAVLSSGLETWVAALLWLLAAGWSIHLVHGTPRPAQLRSAVDGSLWWRARGQEFEYPCHGARRYGPWMLLDIEDAAGRLHRAALLWALLPAEHRRQLGRMLARRTPGAAPSV